MTFSAEKFSNGIGSASPVFGNDTEQGKRRKGVVYDLNLLTLFDEDLVHQVTALHSSVGQENVKYIELGNEFYLSRYEYEFPNASVYMQKALPVVSQIRNLFGDANHTKIAVPADKTEAGHANAWNDQLVLFKKHFDSVTLHDYTAKNYLAGLSGQQQLSLLAIYGRAALPIWIDYVKQRFGKEYSILMTEFNTGCSNETFGYSVLHAMFATSYVTAAVCDETRSMELLMLHLFATQTPDNAWGTFDFVVNFSDFPPDDVDGASFNVVGQILAQMGYIAMVRNNRMTCLDFVGSECPLLGCEVRNNDQLQCLFGVGFNSDTDRNSLGFVVVNACHDPVTMKLDLKTMAPDLNTNVVLNTYEYYYKGDGGINVKFAMCKKGDNVWDEECAAVYADYNRVNLSENQQTLSLKINSMSTMSAFTK